MKLRLYLRNSASIALCSLILLGCSPSTPAKEPIQDMASDIIKIGKTEYNMDLKSWLVGKTLWVYLPLEHAFDEKLNAKDETIKKIEGTRLGIFRVALNSQKPIDFCVFAFCDTTLGYDYFEIMTYLDMKKIWFGYISRGDFRNRIVIKAGLNKVAIDDKEGKHIQPFDVEWQSFFVTQLEQRIKSYFEEDLKGEFKLNSLAVDLKGNNLIVEMDYEKITKKNINASNAVLSIIGRTVNNYDFKDFVELEYNDLYWGKKTIYSRQALIDLLK